MNKGEVIQRRFLAGVSLILLSFIIISCSKDENNEPQVIFTIDLTKPEYATLLNVGSSVDIISKGIIICNCGETQQPDYCAASDLCNVDQSALKFQYGVPGMWKCSTCSSSWTYQGNIWTGPTTMNLKVYSVVIKGNTLTITYP
jgi:Rieske Fe-S protein